MNVNNNIFRAGRDGLALLSIKLEIYNLKYDWSEVNPILTA